MIIWRKYDFLKFTSTISIKLYQLLGDIRATFRGISANWITGRVHSQGRGQRVRGGVWWPLEIEQKFSTVLLLPWANSTAYETWRNVYSELEFWGCAMLLHPKLTPNVFVTPLLRRSKKFMAHVEGHYSYNRLQLKEIYDETRVK